MRAPRSLFLFIPQLVVLALQLFPPTGVILMMLAAPAWAVLLLNLPMAALAIEAIRRRETRIWLIAPILWFGGYALFVAVDHIGGAVSRHRAEASNAAARVPFDPRRQALLILGDHGEVLDMDNRAKWFAANTNAPVVYLKDQTFKALPYAGFRMVGINHCKREAEVSRDVEVGIQSWFLWLPRPEKVPLWERRSDPRLCVWSAPEAIQLPITTVTFERPKDGWSSVRITIVTPEGHREVLSGRNENAPWPWIPLPILGCGLNDQAGAWQCGFSLMRMPDFSIDKQEKDLAAGSSLAARALGLTVITPDERRAGDGAIVQVIGDRLRGQAAREQLEWLDKALADPAATLPWVHFANLADRPDLYAPRLARVVTLVERGQAQPEYSRPRENAKIVFGLIQALPPEAIERYRARIEVLGERDRDFELWEKQRAREEREREALRGRLGRGRRSQP